MIIMSKGIPLRNIICEKIRQVKNTTDEDLYNMLVKSGLDINESRFNKVLMDLEILGFIRVGWITKDKRRIEYRDRDREEQIDAEI